MISVLLAPLKRFVDPRRPITYGIVQAGPDTDGGIPYIRPIDMDEHRGVIDPTNLRRTLPEIAAAYSRSTVRANDIVVSIGPSFGKTMIVGPELDGANLTQGTARVAPASGISSRYLYWALRSNLAVSYWESIVSGATFHALNLEPLTRTPVPRWPIHAQRAIGDFLDAETARIDRLIIKKRQMVNLLKERWEALVLRLLFGEETTRRFLTGQALSMPDTLEVRSLVDLTDRSVPIVYGILLPGPRLEEGVPYIGAGDVARGQLLLEHLPRTTREIASQYPRSRVRAGELVYAIRGTFGSVEQIPSGLDGINLSRDAARISPSSSVNARWLMYALKSELAQEQFRQKEVGATITGINIEDLKRIRLLVPPRVDQDKMVETVEFVQRIQWGLLHGLARQEILLRERRQSLITAAVTGQLEIPGVAA